ncbi:Na(+)-translocating NADH-quinone reductase subunit A [Bacteroidia bacterium]|jgi:Na+-transporting NADH:ubiquinone oxidoreductase subunit A|nr:Na(+)-translocating NADH-quinone reductase subunit A [Bacteroidia bacterium]|tara:strand:+ start:721 stop:2067 length:1347 start_codon:yes stop_codon:yes gene_type:complete
MGQNIKIKRGMDIKLEGAPSLDVHQANSPATFAVKPTDFKGLVPKMHVKQGDKVKAGDCLFADKKNDKICFTAPVSGEIAEVVRGDRRAILAVKILADSETAYKSFNTSGFVDKSREEVVELLLASGLWPFIVQRPYGLLADPSIAPKAIHVSGFDSAPLAADLSISLKGQEANLKTGFEILKKLTEGKVHLNVHATKDSSIYNSLEGVEKTIFSGPHPSGLVGVQINKIDPINKGDVVWTIKPQHVAFIGKFFETGNLDLEQTIVVVGSEIRKPAYYATRLGASVSELLMDNVSNDNVRVISGNVLTGTKIAQDGYLGYYDNQISVIPEGDHFEMLGWLFPSYPRPTLSSTFPLFKFFKKTFKVNTNPHGENRAYVVTGQYEKVMPMNIMPQQLIKSVMAKDLELMENLGIYEVIEEDMALCEFVCTSKIDVQRVLSEGLELMAEES